MFYALKYFILMCYSQTFFLKIFCRFSNIIVFPYCNLIFHTYFCKCHIQYIYIFYVIFLNNMRTQHNRFYFSKDSDWSLFSEQSVLQKLIHSPIDVSPVYCRSAAPLFHSASDRSFALRITRNYAHAIKWARESPVASFDTTDDYLSAHSDVMHFEQIYNAKYDNRPINLSSTPIYYKSPVNLFPITLANIVQK